ncbi:unnamed protein product [Sphacelaria rigidula]
MSIPIDFFDARLQAKCAPFTECELYKEERDVPEGKMQDMNEGGMKSSDALDSSGKTMAVLEKIWWLQMAIQDRGKMCKRFCVKYKRNVRNEHRHVGGASIRSRDGARSRRGCIVNGQTTKTSNK